MSQAVALRRPIRPMFSRGYSVGRNARGRGSVQAIPADLSNEAAVKQVAAAAGDIDILVNNAGAVPTGTPDL